MATSLTYSTVAKGVAGNFRQRVVDITADASYPVGGYTLATGDFVNLAGAPAPPATQALANIRSFLSETNAGGVKAALDRTNGKLVFFEAGAQATTTISSKTVRARVTHDVSNG